MVTPALWSEALNAPVSLAGDATALEWRTKNEQICSQIAEMVWWNIPGATILHALRINCVSMAHEWHTWGAYGI